MESFKVENLSFTYPEGKVKALENVNITIRQGEFILICGKSGCGKTTLLRLLKSSLSPFGNREGNIFFNGKKLEDCDTREQVKEIGFVMQSPDNQIVTDKVWHELAFSLESLGYKPPEIRMRVSEMASFFGIQNWFYKNVNELSGGQKQILNLASVMVTNPSVLILDEPVSQLDPIAAGEFLKTLEKINRELGTTVILTEHRLEEAFTMADRVIVMDNGTVIADRTPKEAGAFLKNIRHDMYKALPTPMRVHAAVENSLSCPLTVREGRMWFSEYSESHALNKDFVCTDDTKIYDETIIEVKDLWFRYEKNSPDVIKGLNMKVNKGELLSVMGGNGTGKTTLLSLISGINKPYRGEVLVKDGNSCTIALLPQNPQSVFVENTVYADLCEALSEKDLTKEEMERKVERIASLCKTETLFTSHPYDLSGGEAQRTALAKILLTEPEILLLDEPTKGMDSAFKDEFAEILADLKEEGVTIIMISHDIEFCAEYSDRCALMFDGAVTSEAPPREFFQGKNFYTTAASRMARAVLPEAVLPDDIIIACGVEAEKKEKKPRKKEPTEEIKKSVKTEVVTDMKGEKETATFSKKTVRAAIPMLLLMAVTIYAGIFFSGGGNYYFTSFLVLLEAIILFAVTFESRKPKASELVVISVMCAVAVAGRSAFFMLPHFKPVAAIVIIAGVCLGAEAGFLTGAVSELVSNFFFGQGPWTPWQMFAYGIIGFTAGVLCRKGFLPRKRMHLCIFGFVTTFILYGGIMNSYSVIMTQSEITWKLIASIFAFGIPFDLIHAFSSAFFLLIMAEPMTEKLERIKIKYGLLNDKR